MYSFSQRPDTIAFDEPLYAHYLCVTGIDHPGKEDSHGGADCRSAGPCQIGAAGPKHLSEKEIEARETL